jgi:tetratricopeptide (TPR) repeat protein
MSQRCCACSAHASTCASLRSRALKPSGYGHLVGALLATLTSLGPLVLASACSSAKPAPPPAVVIKPVALPNLATAAAPLQQLVRERHAAAEKAGTSPTPDPERARAYGELGMVLMAAEYFAEAETALIDAEALAPAEFRWPYYLGHLYRRLGDADKTAAAFERAVRANGMYAPALVWLGTAYLDQGRPDAADPLFEQALMQDPKMVAALNGRGRAALARHDYTGAIGFLERGLAIDPDATALHVPLVLAYRGAGQPEKARAHIRSQGTTQLRPPDPVYDEIDLLLETPVAYELRGARAMSEGRYDEAIAAFQKGVALDPNEPALRHKLATALALRGNLAGALDAMRETVRRSPEFAKGHYSLGLLYLQAGDYRHAAASFADALRVEPAYVEPRLQLAHLLRRTGQSSASLAHYRQILELDPRVPDARFGYAMALVDVGKFADARDQLTQGTQMFPDRPGFVLALARVLAASPDSGVRDGQRALAVLQALPPAAQRTLDFGIVTAMALAESGRFDDAASLQQQVVAQLPSTVDSQLRQHLNQALRSYEQRQPLRRPWSAAEPMELLDTGQPSSG